MNQIISSYNYIIPNYNVIQDNSITANPTIIPNPDFSFVKALINY